MSKLVTPVVQGAFLALQEPKIPPGGDEGDAKFSVTVVLDKDHAWWGKLQNTIKKTAEEKWGKVPAKMINPVKDGDDNDYPEFDGMYTVDVRTKRRPEVIDKATMAPIIKLSDISSGDYMRVSFQVYAWEFSDKGLNRKGVGLSLSNVMWVEATDEPWDGSTSASSDFAEFAEEEGEADDLLG